MKINCTKLSLGIVLFLLSLFLVIGPGKIIWDYDLLLEYLQSHQSATVPIFILVYAILTVLAIPGTLLTFIGGVIFGLWWGTLWTVIGATLGALGAFWVARYLLRDYCKKRWQNNQLLAKFQSAVAKQPFRFVLIVRFVPISPFNLVNFLFGLTPIPCVPYTLATFIGIIPGSLAYTWLGVSGQQALSGGDILPLFLAMSCLFLLSILPWLAKKFQK